jgi:hypothetical protein
MPWWQTHKHGLNPYYIFISMGCVSLL